MGRVDGKIAIVTGASGGLGAAAVTLLAAEGARVMATDIDPNITRVAAPNVVGIEHDVTQASSWASVVAACEREFGPVSVLVNNAGIVHKQLAIETTEAEYRRVIDVNQVGVWLGMTAVLPSMRPGGGSIVNISSTAGLVGLPGIMSYVAAKWAVRGMTKAAAQEFAEYGIRVNSVHPGVIDTAMNADRAADPLIAAQPIKRYGTPEEVARMVVFLASDDASYSTGSEFVVDGGFTSG
jgi:3alpha(or 20beta)-hydroxysteroid dehydrogenase